MLQIQIGMSVNVDVSGLTKNGVSLGAGPSGGTIVAFGREGITVQLHTTVAGVNVVTVAQDRVTATA